VVVSAAKPRTGPTATQVVFGTLATVLGAGVTAALPAAVAMKILGGMVAGLVAGLLPVYLAKRKGLSNAASAALSLTALAGIAMGIILAAPVALGFTWWISRQDSGAEA
jgi:hypothetical protein